jgi:ribulose-5-phosphate 4-epimerase/fuculose-1-phosphate aldolase
MTEAEWQTRVDLAACYRLVAHYDMDDMFATHISARVPNETDGGTQEHFLVNPYGLLFEQVTASNLVKVDLDGNILSATEHVINPAGFVIHSAIHGARPDAACVVHTHTVAGMAVACLRDGLLTMVQKSTRFHKSLAYHDYEGKAQDLDERERLVRDLGDKNAMILRNHGLLTCGKTIPAAFKAIYALEKSCKVQLAALAAGREINLLPDNLIEFTAGQFERDAVVSKERPSGWDALLAKLDRIDPSYRQ